MIRQASHHSNWKCSEMTNKMTNDELDAYSALKWCAIGSLTLAEQLADIDATDDMDRASAEGKMVGASLLILVMDLMISMIYQQEGSIGGPASLK